jgi:hypothetical protein
MSDQEEDFTDETVEEQIEELEEVLDHVRIPPRTYEITMKAFSLSNPKEREAFRHYGLLGLNPGFVLVQNTEGSMVKLSGTVR